MLTLLMLTGGLVLLTVGAEILVRGASALAFTARISPLVVGLTVVAFGTSAPELVVSVQAAVRGQADVAVGNVVGSNIFNVLFILGISALIVPLRVQQQLVRFDVPLLIGLSGLLLVMAWDGRIGFTDGLVLAGGLLAYTTWGISQSRREQQGVQAEYSAAFAAQTRSADSWQRSTGKLLGNVALVVVGLGLLVLGSRWFTEGAIAIARRFAVSELVIGLTIVAAGTSLPEVATSVMAALRGERDIAVGNVVGSNIFNILGVLGISGIVAPAGVLVPDAARAFDMPVMVVVAAACLPIFFTGHLIARWEGLLFLGYYIAYTSYLILKESGQAASVDSFLTLMLVFVMPLTVVTIGVSVVRALRGGAGEPSSGSDPPREDSQDAVE